MRSNIFKYQTIHLPSLTFKLRILIIGTNENRILRKTFRTYRKKVKCMCEKPSKSESAAKMLQNRAIYFEKYSNEPKNDCKYDVKSWYL